MKTRMGLIGLVGLLAGCSVNMAIPKTKVTGSLGGQPFSLETPKDNDLVGLDVTCETNGTVRVHIDKLTARLNPDNVANAGTAQAAIIGATGEAVAKSFAAGAAAGAAALK